MKLEFLGTRGYIKRKTKEQAMHTSTMIVYRGCRVMVDCGENWLSKFAKLKPAAIVITHPHPDHAFGLSKGSSCPVYATSETWSAIKSFPIGEKYRRVLQLRRVEKIAGIAFEPFSVVHSTRAPAVGYRVQAGRVAIFYVPDVVWIHDRANAFRGIKVYVGDGAAITRSMVRKEKRTKRLIGHTPIETQLKWCQEEKVPRMIVTHCGSDIVAGRKRDVAMKLRHLARQRDVELEVATDGMKVVLR